MNKIYEIYIKHLRFKIGKDIDIVLDRLGVSSVLEDRTPFTNKIKIFKKINKESS